MRLLIKIALAFSFLVFNSCIKEIRVECPCYFSLDLSKIDTNNVKSLQIWYAGNNMEIVSSDTILKENFGDYYEVTIPKGITSIYCWGNVTSSIITPKEQIPRIMTNPLSGSDKLYFYKNTVVSYDEFANDTVRLRKEYMGLDICVIGNALETRGFTISVESTSSGFLLSGEVLEGDNVIYPEPVTSPSSVENKHDYHFNILRQKEIEDLRLYLTEGDNGNKKTLLDYPLGEKLLSMGVDMNAEDLGDASILIDFSYLEIKITIEGWNGSTGIEVVL